MKSLLFVLHLGVSIFASSNIPINRRQNMAFRRHILSAIALASLLGFASTASAQNRAFSFAYDQPPTTAYGIAANIFDTKLKELSGGKMSINQFPGAQLGQEPQMLQKMRAGDIDFVITSTANASTVAPQAGVLSLHFIFRDQNHLAKSLADPGIAQAFRDMTKESVTGARTLGLLTMGLRNMYSKKEVNSVNDIKGQKFVCKPPKPKIPTSQHTAHKLFICHSEMSTHLCKQA
jgi:TRAP-type C4-dicarboxylate transport system substrate-binding protein